MINLQDMSPDELQVEMVEMYPIILDQFNDQYRRLFQQLPLCGLDMRLAIKTGMG